MIKSALAAVVAVPLVSGAALAGPYVNVEANSGWKGSDYTGTVTDFHVGYEGEFETGAGWYIQAGPSIVSEDGGDVQTELSGKVGASTPMAEKWDLYGELAFLTDDGSDTDYATKVGVIYRF